MPPVELLAFWLSHILIDLFSVTHKMSQYTTPFLVLNLGSEMVFVVAQRLQAQNVSQERSSLVLDEIISVLISPKLITEITKPQPPYAHDAVRSIIEDVTQASIMRLDTTSMDRLWDLITMVFKWQTTLSPDLLQVTLRHLYEIETYVLNADTHLQLHRVQNVVENFNKIFDQNEKHQIREDVLTWLEIYNIRVSLLLRMGLQGQDGSFIANNSDPLAQDMLKNLGENIYAVTQNGKILEGTNLGKDEEKEEKESHELQVFVDQMLGDRKLSTGSTESGPTLKLMIDDHFDKKDEIKLEIFDNIDASMRDNKLQKIFNDLNLEDIDTPSSVKDDLLEIIGTETV